MFIWCAAFLLDTVVLPKRTFTVLVLLPLGLEPLPVSSVAAFALAMLLLRPRAAMLTPPLWLKMLVVLGEVGGKVKEVLLGFPLVLELKPPFLV